MCTKDVYIFITATLMNSYSKKVAEKKPRLYPFLDWYAEVR